LEIERFEKFSRSLHMKIEEEAASLGSFLGGFLEIKFRN